MKTVTVTLTLLLENDQPVVDWLPDAISELLSASELLTDYSDTEPEV